MKRSLAIFSLLCILTACSGGSLRQLEKNLEHNPSNFNGDMAAEYLEFAQSQQELGNDDTSDHFAKKGLSALHDNAQPETTEQWKIEDEQAKEINLSRDRLVRLRTDFAKKVDSNNVARAQALFDCWVVQVAKAESAEAAAPCHEEFNTTLSELEKTAYPPKKKRIDRLPAHITILFEEGGAELDDDAMFAIKQVMKINKHCQNCAFTITGHTDGVGGKARNMEVSRQRAEAVASELESRGIAREQMSIVSKGEAAPLIPTLDGMVQKRNRRVEVDMKRGSVKEDKNAKNEQEILPANDLSNIVPNVTEQH